MIYFLKRKSLLISSIEKNYLESKFFYQNRSFPVVESRYSEIFRPYRGRRTEWQWRIWGSPVRPWWGATVWNLGIPAPGHHGIFLIQCSIPPVRLYFEISVEAWSCCPEVWSYHCWHRAIGQSTQRRNNTFNNDQSFISLVTKVFFSAYNNFV